jgi:hypothetical protein
LNDVPQTQAEHTQQYSADNLALYQQNLELWRLLYERNEVIAYLSQQLAISKEREIQYLNASNATSKYFLLSN